MEKTWKNIPGYSKLYFACTDGRVVSVDKIGNDPETGRALGTIQRNRIVVSLVTDNGQRKIVAASRLVAETFIPNPNGYKYVRHFGTNTLDNSVENLFWSKDYKNNARVIHNAQEKDQFFIDLKQMVREDFCKKYNLSPMAYYQNYRQAFGNCNGKNTEYFIEKRKRINAVIEDIKAGIPYSTIAKKYDIDPSYVAKIKKRFMEV